MKTTNNSVKYEVLVKQYLPAFVDISGLFWRNASVTMETLFRSQFFAYAWPFYFGKERSYTSFLCFSTLWFTTVKSNFLLIYRTG